MINLESLSILLPSAVLGLMAYYKASAKFQNLILLTLLAILLFFSGWLLSLALGLSLTICYLGIFINSRATGQFKKYILYVSLSVQALLVLFFRKYGLELGGTKLLGITYVSLMLSSLTLDRLWNRLSVVLDLPLLTASTFFPILAMGPIENLNHFKKNFEDRRTFKWSNLKFTFFYGLLGFFKIYCIANPLIKYTLHRSDFGLAVYGPWLFLYCFFAFIKLYAEFSGAIDLVRAVSFLFGVEISINFDRPYISESPAEVWQR